MPPTTIAEPRPTTGAEPGSPADRAPAWAGPPGWQDIPIPAPRARAEASGRRWSHLALCLVALAHVAGVAFLRTLAEPRVSDAPAAPRLTVIDLAVAPPPPPSPPPPPPSLERSSEPVPIRSAPARAAARAAVVPASSAPEDDASPPRLRLFAPDGSLGALDPAAGIAPASPDARRFQFERPGIAGAARAFERPPALVHEPTRFDGGFKPSQDIVTAALERAVKASTIVVMVPVPGAPGYKVGCGIVLLAAAGGCGYSAPKPLLYADDPNTLDADEAAECEQLWARITEEGAAQDAVRLRLQVYDMACRKPLAEAGDARRPR